MGPDTTCFACWPGTEEKFTVTIVLPSSIPFSKEPVVCMVTVSLSDDAVSHSSDATAPMVRARVSVTLGYRLTVDSFLALRLAGSCPALPAHPLTPRLSTQQVLDLEEMVEVVCSLHLDELGDRLPPALVVNAVRRLPLLPRHGTPESEIALAQCTKHSDAGTGLHALVAALLRPRMFVPPLQANAWRCQHVAKTPAHGQLGVSKVCDDLDDRPLLGSGTPRQDARRRVSCEAFQPRRCGGLDAHGVAVPKVPKNAIPVLLEGLRHRYTSPPPAETMNMSVPSAVGEDSENGVAEVRRLGGDGDARRCAARVLEGSRSGGHKPHHQVLGRLLLQVAGGCASNEGGPAPCSGPGRDGRHDRPVRESGDRHATRLQGQQDGFPNRERRRYRSDRDGLCLLMVTFWRHSKGHYIDVGGALINHDRSGHAGCPP